jgi:hypothetical protein
MKCDYDMKSMGCCAVIPQELPPVTRCLTGYYTAKSYSAAKQYVF